MSSTGVRTRGKQCPQCGGTRATTHSREKGLHRTIKCVHCGTVRFANNNICATEIAARVRAKLNG